MRDTLAITKALADPNRLRILCALQRGELCVCQIVAMLHLATSTVSKHLTILYQARLVEARKQGKWMYYRLPGASETPAAVRAALRWVHQALADDPQIRADNKSLRAICCMTPEALCQSRNCR